MADIKGNVRPPRAMPATEARRSTQPEKTDPLLLRLITYVLILRALAFLTLAYILWSYPDSTVSGYLVRNSAFFFKRPPHFSSLEPVEQSARDFLMMGFLLVGLMYATVAWKWLTRFWLARWGTMFLAGASLIKTAVNLFAARAAGIDTALSAAQTRALIVSSLLNLLIFLYLACAPGVAEAFEDKI